MSNVTALPSTFELLPQACGHGYYCYSPFFRQYGTVETVEMLLDICKEWTNCNIGQIGIGDMSLQHGGKMTPHASHNHGLSVDLRPLRTDWKEAPVNINSRQYNYSATRRLAEILLKHKNVKSVLFNDRKISGVVAYRGHDDHLHVQAWR